jgi:uncharacterized membrane protein
MRKEMTILVAAALGGVLAASSTSQAKTVGYTFTEINVPGSQPGSTGQNGLGMNNLGQITGTYNDSSGEHNFLYTNGKYVTVPGAPGAQDTQIFGINDWGQMLGTVYYGDGSHDHFIDTHGKFTLFPNPISPTSINDRGEVLGFGAFPSGADGYGVLNPKGVFTPIDLSGAPGASVSGFNNLGQFTGTVCDSAGCHAFIDTKGVFTKFDVFDASNYVAVSGINDWGQVTGLYFDNEGGHGFLYAQGHLTTIQDLNASPGMGGTWPTAFNDLGEIAGFYYDAEGAFHSFLGTPRLGLFASTAAARLADPVPEPSTWAMVLMGLAGLGFVSLRRRTSRPDRERNGGPAFPASQFTPH